MTATDQAPRWDLEPIFPALDDRAFTAALEGVFADVDRLGRALRRARYPRRSRRARRPTPTSPRSTTVLAATNDVHDGAAAGQRVPLRARHDRQPQRPRPRLARRAADPHRRARAAWQASRRVAGGARRRRVRGAERRRGRSTSSRSQKAAESAELQMGEAEESLAAELAPSGRRSRGSGCTATCRRSSMVDIAVADGTIERVPMAMARGLATHPDAARRRAAYEGELAAWETVAVPLAAALNGAKGEIGVLNRRRGLRRRPRTRARATTTSTAPRSTR